MKRAFVQFYKDILPSFYKDNCVLLQNGFGYIWDEANPIWLSDRDKQLPVEAEEIYISAICTLEIFKVWEWAKQHPETQFIVGGPAVWPGPAFIKLLEPMPYNLTLVEDFAESIFNRPVNLSTWKLYPPQMPQGTSINYTYHIGDACDWGKCIFCSERFKKKHELREYDLEPLWNAPRGIVFLVNESFKAKQLHILEKLNYSDKQYRLHIRATDDIYRELKIILPKLQKPENLAFQIGVEFPSDRMLKWMNKGTTIIQVIEILRLLSEYGFCFMLTYIADWPNLVDEDITSAKKFFKLLESCDSNLGNHYLLPLAIFNKQMEKYIDKEIRVGPFVVGYTATLNEKEKTLNEQWEKLLMIKKNVYKVKSYHVDRGKDG